MATQWKKEQFSNDLYSVPFYKIDGNKWIQRRNIKKESNDGITYYICESRILSNDEYEDLMSQLNSPAQEQTNNYQLDILGALTDLYEMLGGD